jgi:membrane protein DedA with SNARE-associated domain
VEQHILNFIRSVYDAIGWPGVVLLMAIESACIPLPSEIIMPFAGWMLITEKYPNANAELVVECILLAGICGAVGNVIGSLIAYWVGAKGGLPFLRRYGKYLLISEHEIDVSERWFDKYGEGITFFSRLLPLVRTFISFPSGIARMNIWKFIVYSFLGAFIWSTGLAYGGYVLGQHWEKIRDAMRPFDIPIVIVCVLLIVIFILWHWKRRSRNASK